MIEPVPATATTTQASMSSIAQAEAQIWRYSSASNTIIALGVVLGVVFFAFALFVTYRLYMKKLDREDRERYRQARIRGFRRNPVRKGSRRPAVRTDVADIRKGGIGGHHRKGSKDDVIMNTDGCLSIGTPKSSPGTSSSPSSSSTEMTSTDVSSTRAVLRGPTSTVAYPPKAYGSRLGYNSSPCRSKSGSPSSFFQQSKPTTRSRSSSSSYRTVILGKRALRTSSNWPSDRPEPQTGQRHFDEDRDNAAGWSTTETASGHESYSGKLPPFFPSRTVIEKQDHRRSLVLIQVS